MTGRVGSSG